MSAAHVGSESLWKQAFKDAVLALDPSSSSTEARSRTGRPRGSAAGSTHRRTIQSPGTNGARRRQAHHSVPVAGTLKSVSKWGRWLERFTASAGRLAHASREARGVPRPGKVERRRQQQKEQPDAWRA